MAIQSKSQRFANAVFPLVQKIAGGDAKQAVKYKTLCKKSGTLVRNSGLMQTLAFFQSRAARKEEHFRNLVVHLEYELIGLEIIPADTGKDGNYLFEYVRTSSVPQYMYLTREILHLLNWHKRLADTLITRDEEGRGEA